MEQQTTKEKTHNKNITSRQEDYAKWYTDVIAAAGLADNSPVRGCMVIKPYGYALWENIQKELDEAFKKTGVVNAYFPLFIPQSFLVKEAKHVEGFATECAVVTHHRLEKDEEGKLVPAGELDEPLIVRPTSETIMYHMYAKWIESYRDLPILINQWCNVVRWEMRTRPFLRTMEFLWQEGHTAHATKEEAYARAQQMLDVYRTIAEEYLAIPVIAGFKTESEKFAGADTTLTIEAMMQDGKALQSGTSHMLGQNFAKAFDVSFLSENGTREYVWQTSWGLSTRIIGGLIMMHSDDAGLVLPPKIAPIQVVIVPVWKNEEERAMVQKKSAEVAAQLSDLKIRVKEDLREGRPGPKFFEWEKKGVPMRIEIGPRDVVSSSVVTVRRDTGVKEIIAESHIADYTADQLETMQKDLFAKAAAFRQTHTHDVNSWEEFKNTLDKDGGFLMAHWCGNVACESKIKEETKATSRCIPFEQKKQTGSCVYCGKPSDGRVIFARAY